LDLESYEGKVLGANEEVQSLERRLATASDQLSDQERKITAGFEDVIAALPAQSALVAFAQYSRYVGTLPEAQSPKEISPHYLAFVVRSGGDPHLVVLPGEIEASVIEWREAILKAGTEGSTESVYLHVGGNLRRLVWDPLSRHLEDSEMVFLVPDGILNMVSFAALPMGKDQFLVEELPVIHYLSAERDLVVREARGSGSGLLAIGGPDFNEQSEVGPAFLDQSTGQSADPTLGFGFRGSRTDCGEFTSICFEELPGAVEEIREISAIWELCREAEPATILKGPDASESAFKQNARGVRLIHVATHGFFLNETCESALSSRRGVGLITPLHEKSPKSRIENPLVLSGLALAGANKRGEADPAVNDGILTSQEIGVLDLSGVEWAVLSACDTGVGKIETGEGVVGLRRCFEVAGAQTLIMSLWPVEDNATKKWMKQLYSARFSDGHDTANAVRAACLNTLNARRKAGDSTNPFYWGAFVAAGSWN